MMDRVQCALPGMVAQESPETLGFGATVRPGSRTRENGTHRWEADGAERLDAWRAGWQSVDHRYKSGWLTRSGDGVATSGDRIWQVAADIAPEVDVPPLTRSEFLILLALAAEPAHGYRIMQIINDVFAADTRIGPGTLYRALQRLLGSACIAEDMAEGEAVDDERRRPYRLTPFGLDVARREMNRLDTLTRLARARLDMR